MESDEGALQGKVPQVHQELPPIQTKEDVALATIKVVIGPSDFLRVIAARSFHWQMYLGPSELDPICLRQASHLNSLLAPDCKGGTQDSSVIWWAQESREIPLFIEVYREASLC